MASISFRINNRQTLRLLQSQQQALAALPRQAERVFKRATPIRTGNARRNTRLKGGTTIHADYDYASRLDEGSSQQAPKGMTEPTRLYIDKRLREIAKRGR